MKVNNLKPNVPEKSEMYHLIIHKQLENPSWPHDYIYYHYYKSEDGFIIFQEMYDNNKNKKLEKIYIPNSLIESLIPEIAENHLSK